MSKGFLKEEDLEPDVEGFEFYNGAFYELGTSRPIGMGVGPIPFTAIVEYFKIYGTQDEDDFDEFLYVMRRMDSTFLLLNASALKEKQSANTNPDKKNNNKG